MQNLTLANLAPRFPRATITFPEAAILLVSDRDRIWVGTSYMFPIVYIAVFRGTGHRHRTKPKTLVYKFRNRNLFWECMPMMSGLDGQRLLSTFTVKERKSFYTLALSPSTSGLKSIALTWNCVIFCKK